MEKVLITGVNGFVGRRLAAHLAATHDVYGLDIGSCPGREHYFQCDLTDRGRLATQLQFAAFDYVIHCAGLAHDDRGQFAERDYLLQNVEGTRNLVDCLARSRGLRLFVFFSTIAVYGEHGLDDVNDESRAVHPLTPYGKSKAPAEKIIIETPSFPAVILRFPPVYSRDNLKDVVKRVRPVSSGCNIIVGDGNQRSSFCSINNAVGAVAFILSHASLARGSVFHVADPVDYSSRQLLRVMSRLSGGRMRISIPKNLFKLMIGLLSLAFPGKKAILQSVYWKLAENNRYSADALAKIGYKGTSTLETELGI